MKLLITIGFCITCLFCNSQNIRFQLYVTNSCDGVERLDSSFYYLKSVADPATRYESQLGFAILPAKGRYKVFFPYVSMLDSPLVEVRDTGVFVFRYKQSKIKLVLSNALDSPPEYTVCDAVINGYQEDHYDNGQIKLRGTFSRGYIKDSVVTFFETGKIKKRTISLPKITTVELYDESGHLLELDKNQHGSFMEPHDYERTKFFPNGKIESKELFSKRYLLREEYYDNETLKLKQTKSAKTEYYPNGEIHTSYRWKAKGPKNEKDFTIHKNEYDDLGKLIRATVFEEWSHAYYPQPDLDIRNADWIAQDAIFRNGKKVFSVEDIDPTAYKSEPFAN